MATNDLMERIGALLAKAESTEHEEEAQALIAGAQRLATTHQIDIARAEQVRQRTHRREQPTEQRVTIGPRGRQHNARLLALLTVVAHANDVRVDMLSDSTVAFLYGFPSDLHVVETLYASLAVQMTGAAQDAIDRGVHRREEHAYLSRNGTWRTDARVYRANFYDGFTVAIAKRLDDAREEAISESDADTGGGQGSSAALVLADKRTQVHDYYRKNSTASRAWRGASRTRQVSAARRQGRAAGRAARLHSQPDLPGPAGRLTG